MDIIDFEGNQVVSKDEKGKIQQEFGQLIPDKKDKLKIIGYRNKFGVEIFFEEVEE